jgi:RNA polymerase sigma factor (sigma-70 family)
LTRESGTGVRDDEAWEILLKRLHVIARKVVKWDLGTDSERADDLAYDAYLKLTDPIKLNQLAASKTPQNYLFSLVKNIALDEARKSARAAEMEPLVKHELYASPSETEDLGDLQTENRELLQLAMNLLDPKNRLLLHQKYWENKSLTELAEEYDTSYEAIATRIHRAIAKLKDLVDSIRAKDA